MNRLGYDLKYYHSFYKSVFLPANIGTILDIGANEGQFAKEVFENSPSTKVYSFEPIKSCFEALTNDLKSHGDSFKAFNIGLGDKNSEMTINKSDFSPSSSLLRTAPAMKAIYPKSVAARPEKITIKRMDDVLADLKIEGNLAIKMDVQGFEDRVILGGQKTISIAKMLIIETSYVELYEGQPLFDDIYEAVKKLGFSYYGNKGCHYDKNGRLIFEDSVFIKGAIN